MNPKKMNISCVHFGPCPGCHLNENVDSLPLLKEVEIFIKERGLSDLTLHTGNATEWRSRAKLVVRGSSQKPLIGLYKEGSHEVVEIPFCRVHYPAINEAVGVIRKALIDFRIEPYNEETLQGDIRYLQLVVEQQTSKIQLTLVLNGLEDNPRIERWHQFAHKIWESGNWHSLWMNFNETKTNTIFGPSWICCYGDPLLWEKLGGVWVCFQPQSFAQANLDLLEQLLRDMKQTIPQNSTVVEYYAGVGVIGLSLAAYCRKVVCCELNENAQLCFKQSQERLSVEEREKISLVVGDSSKLLHLLSEGEVVIVDPPRKGLDASLLNALCQARHLRMIIYISCGWRSFKRDCEGLMKEGWVLKEGDAYLFFPGTNQLELKMVFVKE